MASPAPSPAVVDCIRKAAADTHNAFVSVAEETSPRTPLKPGPLSGIAFAAKDNLDTVDFPTTANTPALRHSIPAFDNPVVSRLREAGAELIGKTAMHELAFGITSGAGAFPAVQNPVDPSRSSGGSSGGSGAAVAAGVVPFALGTDTGGSVSIPAAWCGVYGYRPTTGRWPDGGTVPLSATRDTVGVIAESLDWIARVDALVTGQEFQPSEATENLRIGVPDASSEYVAVLDDDVREVWERALDAVADTPGVTLVPIDTGRLHELDRACGIGIVMYESIRDLSEYLCELPTPVDLTTLIDEIEAPDVKGVMAEAFEGRDQHESYEQLLQQRAELQDTFDGIFTTGEINSFLRPTVPITATPIEDSESTMAFGGDVPLFPTVIRNTGPGSLSSQPTFTLPGGRGPWGRPVGISLEGARGRDRTVMAEAFRIDSALRRGARQ